MNAKTKRQDPYAPLGPVLAAALLAASCTHKVNSTFDAPDADPGDRECESTEPVAPGAAPTCTLRAAIMEANSGGSRDRIEVPPGTYTLTLGVLDITNPVHIQGSGAGETIVDADRDSGVFEIDSDEVTLNHMTVRNGDAQAGAGILVRDGEDIAFHGLSIENNVAFSGGGGLWLEEGGEVRMRRSAVKGNSGAQAGGIYTKGTLWIWDSSITGNSSTRAGGIQNASTGLLNLRNVTLSENEIVQSTAGTGGLYNGNFAVLNNVTLTENRGSGNSLGSFRGGGLQMASGSNTVMRNSILAENDGGGGPPDCVGTFAPDSRYNLVETVGSDCTLPGATGSWLLDQSPTLGVLVSVPGSPASYVPLGGGVAESAGYRFPPPAADGCEPRDVLGVPRHQDSDDCDLGAAQAASTVGRVIGFMLVNADTDLDIKALRDGDRLYRGDLPPNLAIRAVTFGAPGSVVFDFGGMVGFRTENNAPFSVGGDTGGDHSPLALDDREYDLAGRAFAGENGTGEAGGVHSIAFSVVD